MKEKDITAKAIMNLRRNSGSETNKQKDPLIGTLKSADSFEKADTLTHQWQNSENAANSLSARGILCSEIKC